MNDLAAGSRRALTAAANFVGGPVRFVGIGVAPWSEARQGLLVDVAGRVAAPAGMAYPDETGTTLLVTIVIFAKEEAA